MRFETTTRACKAFFLAALMLLTVRVLCAQDKAAAIKQSLANSQKMLAQFQWVETTTISLKGEEKSRVQKQCFYGPDGKVVKQEIGAPAQQSTPGGLRGRMAAKKKGEISDYMKAAVALVQQYVPPDPQRIQAAKDAGNLSLTPVGTGVVRLDIKNYLKPGDLFSITVEGATNLIQKVGVNSYLDSEKDAVGLDVTFATLPGGINYVAKTTLVAPEKKVQVDVQNSDYQTR